MSEDLERPVDATVRSFRTLATINVIGHRIVAPTTETDAERAWKFGFVPGKFAEYYGYQVFDDDSMITILGVYRCRREAFVHSERLFARYRMERKDIGD